MVTMKRRKSSMNVLDSPGSPENDSLDLVDRISDLPDSILGIILSSLFTKNAVATSVLSKRWKFVWRTVHNLFFWHYGYSEGEDMRFVEFVNRVFLQHDARLFIAFGLVWKPRCNFFHVSSWIRTAITRNVPVFFLEVETRVGPDSSPQPIELPISVFSSDSLRSLELTGGISVSNVDAVCLPRLVSLKLVSVDFQTGDAFEKFISGCPALICLHVHMDIEYMVNYFGRDNHFTYVISSTSLRSLQVYFYYDLEPQEYTLYCSLELKASSLEYLKLDGFIYDISVQGSLSSLIKADIGIYFRENDFFESMDMDPFVEVVRALNCAKTLTLSGDAMWALSCTRIRLATEFKRLVNLETTIYCCYCSILRELVQSSDNLEVLTIYQHPNYQDRNDRHNHSTWRAPVEVPRCLSNSLKKVVVDVYYGFGDEREMISYLLKHGSVLEVMKISLDSYREHAKFELLQEISMFPRKSPACKIEFVVD